MLNCDSTIVKVQRDGKIYDLKKVTFRQAQNFAKDAEGKSDAESSEMLLDLLEQCGLPREVSENMEVGHINMISQEVMPQQKK